jgi:hypothetical protein
VSWFSFSKYSVSKILWWLSSERSLRAYRNQQVFKNTSVIEISLLSGGLDTSRKNRAGLLDHQSIDKQKAPAMTGAWYNKAHYPMNLVQVCAQVPVLQGM